MKASITGSIIANVLLVLRASILAGGMKFREQRFKKSAARTSTTRLTLAAVALAIPNAGEIEPGLVAHHWIVRGTDIGPRADGSQATGRSFSFKGASIIQVEGDKIRSDQCYFDRKALDKQLEPA